MWSCKVRKLRNPHLPLQQMRSYGAVTFAPPRSPSTTAPPLPSPWIAPPCSLPFILFFSHKPPVQSRSKILSRTVECQIGTIVCIPTATVIGNEGEACQDVTEEDSTLAEYQLTPSNPAPWENRPAELKLAAAAIVLLSLVVLCCVAHCCVVCCFVFYCVLCCAEPWMAIVVESPH